MLWTLAANQVIILNNGNPPESEQDASMNDIIEFDEEFLAFAGIAGYVPREEDGRSALFSNDGGGEIRFSLDVVPGAPITVLRADRNDDPEPVFITSDPSAAVRFLVMEIGPSVRAALGLERVMLHHVDPSEAGPATGFRLLQFGDGSFGLAPTDGEPLPLQTGQREASRYSFIADVPVQRLRESYLSPDGEPALHDAWQRWQSRIAS